MVHHGYGEALECAQSGGVFGNDEETEGGWVGFEVERLGGAYSSIGFHREEILRAIRVGVGTIRTRLEYRERMNEGKQISVRIGGRKVSNQSPCGFVLQNHAV